MAEPNEPRRSPRLALLNIPAVALNVVAIVNVVEDGIEDDDLVGDANYVDQSDSDDESEDEGEPVDRSHMDDEHGPFVENRVVNKFDPIAPNSHDVDNVTAMSSSFELMDSMENRGTSSYDTYR